MSRFPKVVLILVFFATAISLGTYVWKIRYDMCREHGYSVAACIALSGK